MRNGSVLVLEPNASELCGVLGDLRLLWWARRATWGQRGECEPDIQTVSQKQLAPFTYLSSSPPPSHGECKPFYPAPPALPQE